jgi:hypothetical protein
MRKLLVLLPLLLLLLLPAAPTASASTGVQAECGRTIDVSGKVLSFDLVQRKYSVVRVAFGNGQAKVTCLLGRPTSPDLFRDSCNSNNSFVLYNYNYSGELCFTGSGYLGVNIYQVNQVNDTWDAANWIRYYDPPGSGHFCTLVAGHGVLANSVTVTQLDGNGTNGPLCPGTL